MHIKTMLASVRGFQYLVHFPCCEYPPMLEYAFFHAKPFDAFIAALKELGLQPQTVVEEDYWEVQLPEDLDDGVSDRVEQLYEQMMEWNQELHDAEADGDYHTAGVVVNLNSGDVVYAQVDPAILGRIMSVLTPDEFGRVVDAIVDAVETPDERTLCQRMRESDGH